MLRKDSIIISCIYSCFMIETKVLRIFFKKVDKVKWIFRQQQIC